MVLRLNQRQFDVSPAALHAAIRLHRMSARSGVIVTSSICGKQCRLLTKRPSNFFEMLRAEALWELRIRDGLIGDFPQSHVRRAAGDFATSRRQI